MISVIFYSLNDQHLSLNIQISNMHCYVFLEKEPDSELSLGAKVGIGIAGVFFVGLLIAVIVIMCDVRPSKSERKSREDKNGKCTL